MEIVLGGIPAAPGSVVGRARVLHRDAGPDPSSMPTESPDRETEKLDEAIRCCCDYFDRLHDRACSDGDKLSGELFDSYGEMITDDELRNDIVSSIREGNRSAFQATKIVFDGIVKEMLDIEAEYARQRVDDIRCVRDKLIRSLRGRPLDAAAEWPEERAVLFGNDLTPTDTDAVPKDRLLAIVSQSGGTTSHVSILARNLGIPCVVAVRDVLKTVRDGQEVLVDGFDGKIVFEPNEAQRIESERKQDEYVRKRSQRDLLKTLPAQTRDGRRFYLLANIGNVDDVELAVKSGADGIGLFRTEFLFIQSRTPPSEDVQFRAYRRVLETMDGKPVTFRTLDIGGDKPLDYLRLPVEMNPFLGLRACRMYESHPEIVRTQLRALLRASAYGTAKIMFPMIVSPKETRRMLRWIDEIKTELRYEKQPVSEIVSVGIMVETPAAALTLAECLDGVDFCSLGTNDLTQYTLAVDRGNEHVASLYDPTHPAVLRLIRETVQTAGSLGKKVSLCGELASDLASLPFFMEIGLDRLSMTPALIPTAKEKIRSF